MKALWRIFIIAVILLGMLAPAGAQAQGDTPETRARALLSTLTPEERVGQLFLVSFEGRAVEAGRPIYDLIYNHHIGGVVLRSDNDNFAPPPGTVEALYALTSALQNTAWQHSLDSRPHVETGQPWRPAYVPLFVAVQQNGGGPPADQILSGFSPQPSQMALGASWNLNLVRQSAQILGRELAAVGLNMLLGPSLDVNTAPDADRNGDPGTMVFGGDPFWVGRMGQIFVDGLHTGSQNRVLVVPGHFPGLGMIDRDPREEIPALRRTLEQLQQVELAPFFAVTGNAPNDIASADGLLVSQIRYQGFQGNIRLTSRPIGLDAASLGAIFSLEPLASWRVAGGLTVSDALDSDAIRNFYDPNRTGFNPALVARDAFLAGNDLIILGNIQGDGQSTYESVLAVLDFFVQKYRSDPVFASRVDDAVLRILQAKYRLYPAFVLGGVVPPKSGLRSLGAGAVALQAAREAATLVSPDASELESLLGTGPAAREHMVFITEPQVWRQCPDCPAQVVLDREALARKVQQLYGVLNGGEISSAYLHSYVFEDLDALTTGGNADLEADLRRARWIVLAAVDLRPNSAAYRQLQALLTGRPDLLREKRIVLFNFGTPYALDATDISKLTAYYALYSPWEPFVDTAVRLLFQEFVPSGDLPVSMPAVGYDLAMVTSPDPDQLLTLQLEAQQSTPAPTPSASGDSVLPFVPALKLGDTVTIRTGRILDHNGHIVPDGTVVTFLISRRGSGESILQQVVAETQDGVAVTSLRLENIGLLEISAVSEPAYKSVKVLVNVDEGGAAQVVVVTPTSSVPETPVPTLPATPETLEPDAVAAPLLWEIWWQAILFLGLGGWIVYQLESLQSDLRWGARRGLVFVMGGLAVLNLLFWLGAPDQGLGNGTVMPLVVAGAFLGWLAVAIWKWLRP